MDQVSSDEETNARAGIGWSTRGFTEDYVVQIESFSHHHHILTTIDGFTFSPFRERMLTSCESELVECR